MSAATDAIPRVFLNPGHDQRMVRGHPWAYSNEIRMDAATRALARGTVATMHRVDGKALGVGTFNPHALISFRLFEADPTVALDQAFFVRRLQRALALRQKLFAAPFYRLVHAEADGLPGLIVDRFGDVVVLQANTAGIEALMPALLAALDEVVAPATVILRNDTAMRRTEGLEQDVRVAKGELDAPVEVKEGDAVFLADVIAGQKTGWFFDQRDNRALVASIAAEARVLDVFCYSGSFSIVAAMSGARSCLGIDASESALTLAEAAAARNRLEARCRFQRGEAFQAMDGLITGGERFDVVVCDPPAFVKSRKDLASGLRGYRKLTRLAASLVEPGGMLFIASCSHNVDPPAFFAEVSRGIGAAGREGRVIREGRASADHPLHLHLPESAYLKSLLIQVD